MRKILANGTTPTSYVSNPVNRTSGSPVPSGPMIEIYPRRAFQGSRMLAKRFLNINAISGPSCTRSSSSRDPVSNRHPDFAIIVRRERTAQIIPKDLLPGRLPEFSSE